MLFILEIVISNPIVKITKIIKKAGNLDLTYDNEFDKLLKNKDEIGELSNAFNSMRNELVMLIKQILEKSKDMSISKSRTFINSRRTNIKSRKYRKGSCCYNQ